MRPSHVGLCQFLTVPSTGAACYSESGYVFFVTVNMDALHSDSSYVDPFAAVEAPETETTEAPWGKGDIGWAVLGAVLSIPFAVVLGVVLVLSLDISEAVLTLAVSGFIEGVLFTISWRYSILKYHCSWGMLGFRNRWRIVNLAMVGAGLVLALAAAIIYGGILRAVGLGDSLPSAPDFVESGPNLFAWGAVLAVVVAPVAEETFFRGFIFGGLRGRIGFWWAAAASATLFAFAHLDPITFVPIFIIGLVLVWVYSRTGSLWYSIQLHMGYNAIVLMLG